MTDTPPEGWQEQPKPAFGQPNGHGWPSGPGQKPQGEHEQGPPRPEQAPPGGRTWPGQPTLPTPPAFPPPGYTPPGQPGYGQPGYGQPGYGQPGYGQPGGWTPPALAPGGIPLRPLAFGEIFSGAFTLIRKNPAATLGLIGLGDVVGLIVGLIVGAIAAATGSGALSAVIYPPVLVVQSAVLGGLIAAAGRAYLGQKISIAESIRRCRLGWFLLAFLMYWAMIALVWFLPPLALKGYGIPISFALGAWLGISFCLVFPVVVLERRNPIDAMARSWQLVKGSFWRIFGIFALLTTIVVVLLIMLSLVLELLAFLIIGTALSGTHSAATTTGVLIFSLIALFIFEVVLGGLITALGTGILVLLYADLRMRKEGLDLVLQQAVTTGQLTGDEFAYSSPGAPPGSGYPGGGYPGAAYVDQPPAY